MKRETLLLVALLVLSGCASELVLDREGALAVIPLQVSDSGGIVVETMLNGSGPFEFSLDTGASITSIFDRAKAKASIEPLGGKTVRVLGMTGSAHFPVANVARITVGSEIWEDARVALLPDATPVTARTDGILGVDFLSRYAVWYSQGERVLRLYPKELVADSAYLGWNSIPLFDIRVGGGDVSMLAFDMFIDAKRISTLFDLGTSANLMNRRAAKILDVRIRESRNVTDVWGVTGKTAVLAELIVRQLKIENMYWRNRRFLIGDFPIFEALDIRHEPVAIVGTGVFKKRDFIIDFERKRLLVGRVNSGTRQ